MQRPLVVLVLVYATGMLGMMLIPGIDGEPMGVFHAFYFMTYTASTTGFGELPQEFSDPQRLWATVCLYLSVVSWLYAIGSIIALVQNPHFTRAVAQARFAQAVGRVRDPFFIVCGFGDTGSILARGLSDRHMSAVVIDSDIERIKALALRDYNLRMPGLEGDASVPKNLQDAGLTRPNCRGVVLLTGDEDVNLKTAVMVRLLNPAAEIICRSTGGRHDEELAGLGAVELLHPYETWARELGLALHEPMLHTLDEWLVGARGVTLDHLVSHPRGRWILCGYGALGQALHLALGRWGVDTAVIDPNLGELEVQSIVHSNAAEQSAEPASTSIEAANAVVGLATRANLETAGIDQAAGIVAATHSDADNLAILLTARNLNPDVHLVVRQNSHENETAFAAASADLIMQPSLVTARRLLLRLISPLILEFLDHLATTPKLLQEVVFPRLRDRVGATNPALWTVQFSEPQYPLAVAQLEQQTLTVGDILRDSRDRDRMLPCVALLLRRDKSRIMLPADSVELQVDDELLLCGRTGAESRLRATLSSQYVLKFLASGQEPVRSVVLNWLFSKRHG